MSRVLTSLPVGSCLRVAETTSTTGPHVRDWQYCGVANVTTNGTRAASASATELRYSARSGWREVVRASRSPPVLARVGVRDGIARSPTEGAALRCLTTTFPRAWIFAPPAGFARNQYVPGDGVSIRAT